MKRIIALVMVLFLLTAPFSSLAEEKEIRFRDIEWGLSCPEVLELLKKEGLHNPGITFSKNSDVESMIGYPKENEFDLICAHSAIFSSSVTGDHITVAGYDARYLQVFFAYTDQSVDPYSFKNKNTDFFMANYTIDLNMENEASITKDFLIKMIYLYGEDYIRKEEITSSSNKKWYIWHDTYGNMLVLSRSIFNNAYGYIDISYIKADANETIQNSYNIVKNIALAEEIANLEI